MAVHPNGVPVSPMDREIAIYEVRRNAISTDARPQTGTTETQSPTVTRTSTADKRGFFAQVRSFSTSSFGTEFGSRSDEEKPAWIPTWLRPLPLLGIGALVLATACMVASLGILIGSNEQPATWRASPSVWIAIFTAICNRSVEFALVQALPIAWWYFLSRGCTVNQMQQNWEAGQGVFRAIMNAKAMPLLAFATIMATLVAIDGPLLQKASSVQPLTQTKPTTLQLQLAPELPAGFSGFYDENGIETSHMAAPVLEDYLANSTIFADVSGCKGTCKTTVKAPGIMIRNCSVHSWPITPAMLQNSSATWGSGYSRKVAPAPIFTSQMYDSALHPGHNGPEEMELLVGIANYTNCTGNYVEHLCTLVPAILEYDITISDRNVVDFTRSHGRIVAMANNTHVDSSQPTVNLTFTLLGAFLEPQIFANASLAPVNPGNPSVQGNISVPHQDSFNVFALDHAIDTAATGACNVAFRDPTADILREFNNLAFRSGIVAAKAKYAEQTSKNIDHGLSINQTVSANQTLTLNVYHSDLRWFAGAAVLEIIAILAVAPVFWGFWRLGVRVSFSPLDIAKAFGAPLLKNVNSAAGPRGIVARMGEIDVRYGAVDDIDYDISMIEAGKVPAQLPKRVSRLAVGKSHNVRKPRKGMRFDR